MLVFVINRCLTIYLLAERQCVPCLLYRDFLYEESEDWLKLVDRGRLTHINSKMFHFMTSMELVVKAFLKNEYKPRDVKTEMLKLIEESEAVKCSWRAVSAEWDSDES